MLRSCVAILLGSAIVSVGCVIVSYTNSSYVGTLCMMAFSKAMTVII